MSETCPMGDHTSEYAAAYDLIYLLGCAVNERVPDLGRVERMDMERIHGMSVYHSLTAVTCMALENTYGGVLPQTELFRKWTEEKNYVIYKLLLFDIERDQLLSFLEESGIRHMPLKGILLKDLYPQPGMRQMADNDIWFDAACQEQVHDWFMNRGYKAVFYKQSNHDAYHKKPVYNFEMHTSLFEAQANRTWQEYYADIQNRMFPDDNSRYGYHMSDEDFYIYMITHSCKHYRDGGTGLRSLLDCYVYNAVRGDGLDRAYINAELKKLGIAEFEDTIRNFSLKLFAQPERVLQSGLDENETEFLWEFLNAGTYGTMQKHVYNKLKKMEEGSRVTERTKLRYIWKRVFPDPEYMKNHYPFFSRHRWLLPAGYIYRLIYRGITKRKKLAAEASALKKA